MSSAASAEKASWVRRVLRVDVSAAPGTAPGQGLAQWQSARMAAVASLSALEGRMRNSPHPQRDAAIILIRAIRANLTEAPTTLQQVQELQRYLSTDDIVDAAETPNVFGITISLKRPLLDALATLGAQLVPQPEGTLSA